MEPGQTQGHTEHPQHSFQLNKNQDSLVSTKRLLSLKDMNFHLREGLPQEAAPLVREPLVLAHVINCNHKIDWRQGFS